MLQANGIVPLNNSKKHPTAQPDVGCVKKEHRDVMDVDDEDKAQRIKELEVNEVVRPRWANLT